MNILVTGGASGLGASIVKVLAGDSGNTVYFTYASSSAAAKETEALYANTKSFPCDFHDPSSVDTLINAMTGLDIDVLVNNAFGSMHKEHFYKTEPGVFSKGFEQNIVPTLRITREAIRIFRKKKFGKIINIISTAVIGKPPIGWSQYAAEKSYLLAMSRSWATECIKFNITSNCISPAFMRTNLTGDTDERIIEQMIAGHPLQKLLTTDEVADAVQFFTRASQQINGVNLVMNAGAELA